MDLDLTGPILGRGEDDLWKGVVVRRKGLLKSGKVRGERGLLEAVRLCKKNRVRTSQVGEPEDELDIDLLRRNLGIHEDEGVGELLTLAEVVRDKRGEEVAMLLGPACVAIAREVDEVACLGRNLEEVNEFCLSRTRGGLGEVLPGGQHVENGGFAHIGAANEGDLLRRGVRARRELGGGGEEGGLANLHRGLLARTGEKENGELRVFFGKDCSGSSG